MIEEVQLLEEEIQRIITKTILLEETQVLTRIHQAEDLLPQQQEAVVLQVDLLQVGPQLQEEEEINPKS